MSNRHKGLYSDWLSLSVCLLVPTATLAAFLLLLMFWLYIGYALNIYVAEVYSLFPQRNGQLLKKLFIWTSEKYAEEQEVEVEILKSHVCRS